MKKIFFLIFSSLLILGVMGCSVDDDDSPKQPDKEPVVEKKDNTDDSSSDGSPSDSFNFVDFELEVEYTDHKEYEAEYELDNGNIEAKIEDDLNGTKIKGDDAFQKLEPMLKELNIKQDTPKEDAIREVMNTFDLPDDYLKFELEMTFDDNTQIEFEDRK